jgi:hypothetical protein
MHIDARRVPTLVRPYLAHCVPGACACAPPSACGAHAARSQPAPCFDSGAAHQACGRGSCTPRACRVLQALQRHMRAAGPLGARSQLGKWRCTIRVLTTCPPSSARNRPPTASRAAASQCLPTSPMPHALHAAVRERRKAACARPAAAREGPSGACKRQQQQGRAAQAHARGTQKEAHRRLGAARRSEGRGAHALARGAQQHASHHYRDGAGAGACVCRPATSPRAERHASLPVLPCLVSPRPRAMRLTEKCLTSDGGWGGQAAGTAGGGAAWTIVRLAEGESCGPGGQCRTPAWHQERHPTPTVHQCPSYISCSLIPTALPPAILFRSPPQAQTNSSLARWPPSWLPALPRPAWPALRRPVTCPCARCVCSPPAPSRRARMARPWPTRPAPCSTAARPTLLMRCAGRGRNVP